MIRVFIVADSKYRADAIAAQLEDDRLEIADIQRADVILCVGVPLQRVPRRGRPVVAVSGEGGAPFDEIIKGWLPKDASLEEIAAALTAAARGYTVLTKQQINDIFQPSSSLDREPVEFEALTVRELEVLQMVAAGLGNKEIAARLRISTNTAKFHVAQILAKLGAGSRTEAVSIAIRRGVVPI